MPHLHYLKNRFAEFSAASARWQQSTYCVRVALGEEPIISQRPGWRARRAFAVAMPCAFRRCVLLLPPTRLAPKLSVLIHGQCAVMTRWLVQ